MFPRVSAVRHVGEYRLEISFKDGESATIDLKSRIVGRGGVFSPLEDIGFFREVRADPESGTIVWPNGVDFDPDVLYSLAMNVPLPIYEMEAVP